LTPDAQAADRWRRVRQITSETLERPESERPSWLAEACAGDEALYREVHSLLTAHARAGAFLETPGLAHEGAAEAIEATARHELTSIAAGRDIGPYRIVRELGQGGMGIVYLAERADAVFEKQVAIKVVLGGFASGPWVTQRFHEERRILATLDHPNIARLLDGGTIDGVPYFVMEYVDGVPLDLHCEAIPLSVEQRLVRFRQVCAAVHYAHQRLVIHRDLKARNILVRADGTPKLLDFGIARLLEPGLAPGEQTRTRVRPLTLEGASPEQVRGEPMTVTSDVYALGALLYRLLTGQSPYGSRCTTDNDLIRAICEEDPVRPSAVAPLERRRALRGDLDWIVLKALRKEPDRRYSSVDQLADDIGRHLDGRSVTAAPDSWRYRARKFVVRHRAGVAAGALLGLSLLGGLTATLWQARRAEQQRARAERRFNDVRKLANVVVGELHDAIKDLPGATVARKLLVTQAVEYLDNLAAEATGDESLQRELAGAYLKIGDAQGNPFVANLGDAAAAQRSYEKAFEIYAAQAAAHPDDALLRRDLAKSQEKLATMLWAKGEHGQALERYHLALGIYEALAAKDASSLEDRYNAARALHGIGQVHLSAGDLPAALDAYRQTLAMMSGLAAAAPQSLPYRRGVALAATKIGDVAFRQHDYAAALASHAQAERVVREIGRENPGRSDLRREQALMLTRLAIDHSHLNRRAEAIAINREVTALFEALSASDPENAQIQFDMVAAYNNLAEELDTQGDSRAATAAIRRAISIAEGVHARHPGYANERRKVPTLYLTLGMVLSRTDTGAGAMEAYGKAASLLEAEPAASRDASQLGEAYAGLGDVQAKRAAGAPPAAWAAEWRSARHWYEESLSIWVTLRDQGKLAPDLVDRPKQAERGIERCRAALARAP
jgi:tetratricopeptide (TPR) repeat protein